MPVKVGFHNPDFPDGITFDIGGIAVPNNGSTELTYEQELRFYAERRQSIRDYFKDSPHVTVEGKTELSTKDRAAYPGFDETSTETIIEEDEVDPSIPETDPETGEVINDDEATEGSES